MKKKLFILPAITALLILSACTDYLDKKNLDTMDDQNMWTSENNLRIYAQRFYAATTSKNTSFFQAYGSGFAYGPVFSWAAWADDQVSASQWVNNTATTGNGWDFAVVRNANILINRVDRVPMDESAKNHWKGIGRFFRALRYSDMCYDFGAVPWIDREMIPGVDDELLYADRLSLPNVLPKIMEDFEYAVSNIRVNDGVGQVNKDIVLAFYARYMLYFGTLLKYHNIDATKSTELLNKAVWAANEVIKTGKYQIVDDYRGLFTSESLTTNKEVIMFREYIASKVMHVVVSYNNIEPQTGISKDMIESYLATDGLPIKQSAAYNYASDNGQRKFETAYKNRDPRLYATIVDTIRLNKQHSYYSTTGMASWKFLPEGLSQLEATTNPAYISSTNTTDAPVIRYGEILLIYAEALAELGTLTQADLDKSINVLRNRKITLYKNATQKLPLLKLQGGMPAVEVNGVLTTINDPDRDPSVSSLIWEIRRERRVELIFEGFRKGDLRRWKKYDYLLTDVTKTSGVPSDITLGVWIDQADYPTFNWINIKSSVLFYYPNATNKTKGYIWTTTKATEQRDWVSGQSFFDRQYLDAIPLDQIKLYSDKGYSLSQNIGWDVPVQQ